MAFLHMGIDVLKDVFPYAGELILLFGILLLLLHFTKLSPFIEYSTQACVFVLGLVLIILVQLLNIAPALQNFNGSLILNSDILKFKIVIVFLAILIMLVSQNYFKDTKLGYFEYNILFLLGVFGCLITLASNDLLSFYISLEIQALAFYIMATIKKSAAASEAGLKYFIIGSFSSALLLFGISLIVLLTGHFNFDNLYLFWLSSLSSFSFFESFGVFLIITALLIKLAVAPFHEWVADIYEGLMTPTALLFATLPKISNFFILTRLVEYVFVMLSETIQVYLCIICLLSLFFGCINAFKQQNMKRFLAFSSVNHFGFILIGLVLGTKTGIEASFFYLTFYIILTFGLWTSLILLTYKKNAKLYQLTRITELGGLVVTNPGLALSLILMLLSTGAIPPLAGFSAKVSVFFTLLECQGFFSIIFFVALFSSILSVYYYIRVIKISFSTSAAVAVVNFDFPKTGSYVLAFITAFNLFAFLLFLT